MGEKIPSYSKNIPNILAWIVITAVTLVFLSCLFISIWRINPKEPLRSINFKLDTVRISKLDSTFIIANEKFIDQLNLKTDSLKLQIERLMTAKADIDDIQKKNEDYFKLILALIGSVFAIVAFFGFKSINDTRQATLDAAKLKAESIAETSAKLVAEKVVKEYLDKDGKEIMTNSASSTATSVAEKVAKQTSYITSKETAENITKDEVNRLLRDQNDFRESLRSDLHALEKSANVLRSRIIDLEALNYGEEDELDDDNLDTNIDTDKNPVV